MQLKSPPRAIRHGLIAASCALLGVARAKSQDLPEPALQEEGGTGTNDLTIDSALSYYHEDGRIRVIEPIVGAVKDFDNGQVIDLHLMADSLSGATPNGALTGYLPQTFTGPSGKHQYTTAPGRLPVDPFYHDLEVQASGSWQLPLSRVTSLTVGAKFSVGHDFMSMTGSASIARDFNERNTTLSLGVYEESDRIGAVGGTPVPLSDYSLAERESSNHHTRNDIGTLIGVTQVMNRYWLAQANVSLDRQSGYLTDPYKIMSVIDSGGSTTGYLYEMRPTQRTRGSLYLDNRVGGERESVNLALRYFRDDWAIRSYTARLRYRWWSADKTSYWEPSLRWYRQTAADFYSAWVPAAAVTDLLYASADQRLAALHALTYGLEYGINLGTPYVHPKWLTVRIQYYRQVIRDRTPGPGPLADLNLYPGLTAIQAQVTYSF